MKKRSIISTKDRFLFLVFILGIAGFFSYIFFRRFFI